MADATNISIRNFMAGQVSSSSTQLEKAVQDGNEKAKRLKDREKKRKRNETKEKGMK
jgi:hypothetical protein